MNSFTLTAVGHLARSPETVAKGDVTYTRFCLIGNDYAGKDEEGISREIVTSVWFVAFGAAGETIARHTHKGDQLIVQARVRSNNWTDKQGEKQYDLAFVVQGFKFGAPGKSKREELEGRREHTLSLPRGVNRGNGRERDRGQVVSGTDGEVDDTQSVGVGDEDRPEASEHKSADAPEPRTRNDYDGLEPQRAAPAELTDTRADAVVDAASPAGTATDAAGSKAIGRTPAARDSSSGADSVGGVGVASTSGAASAPGAAKAPHEKSRSRPSRKAAAAVV